MSSHLRRGFKSEADWYARDMRSELGLEPEAPLCPWRLAEHLAIPVQTLGELLTFERSAVKHLRSKGSESFSAFTLIDCGFRTIVHNDSHAPGRQASNIAHELAHALLLHPALPVFSEGGCRTFNPRMEAEASWLGPALLVSKEAALKIAWRDTPVDNAAEEFGVSPRLMSMRLDATGARKIVARSRAAKGGWRTR